MPRILAHSHSIGPIPEALPEKKTGVVVALFNQPAAHRNEGLRERQYKIQHAMLQEALKNAPPAIDLTELYRARTQAVSFNPVRAKQAALQENRGSIFSSAFAHIRP